MRARVLDRLRQNHWPPRPFLLAILAAFSWTAQPALAQSEPITASYQWVSSLALADGSYAATFAFSFTNNSSPDIADLRVRLIDSPPYVLAPQSDDLAVGPLAIGSTASGFWALRFPHPIEATEGLVFLGEGSEADGTGQRLPVMILQEEAAQ